MELILVVVNSAGMAENSQNGVSRSLSRVPGGDVIRPRFLKMIYKLCFSTICIYYQHNVTEYIYIVA